MTIFFFGDNINTDVIFPGKYLFLPLSPSEMVAHAFEDLEPNFARRVKEGDIIIAGKNFGCGSSREEAVEVLQYAGISLIVAKSFSRTFFRNCINCGMLIIECPEAVDHVKENSKIEVLIDENKILVDAKSFLFQSFPDELKKIFKAGGLLAYLREKFSKKDKQSF